MTPEQEREVITEAAQRIIGGLEAEVRRLRRKHDPRCLSLTESENNVYCDCRTLALIDGAAAVTERMTAERDHLRAAVDAALALHYDDGDGCCAEDGYVQPCRTVRALAPVADPDPHTTSDEETTT